MQPDYVIKNRVTEQDFEQIVYQWLSEGDYTPDDIIENIITQNNMALMPIYYSKYEYSGTCSVSLGYRREEFYYTWDELSKKQVRHSRWVTDWHPHSQHINDVANVTTYVGAPLIHRIVSFVENMGWKAEDLVNISPGTPRFDEMCNLFKLSENDVWDNSDGKNAYDQAIKQTVSKLPSPLYSNLVIDVKFTKTLFISLLVPYWLFSYQYQDTPYYVIVDGNNPKRIDGIKPEDKKRKSDVIKLKWFGWSVGTLGIIVALYFFSNGSFENLELDFGSGGIVIAGMIITAVLLRMEVGKIKNKSKKVRKELLSKKYKQLEQ